MKIEDFRIEQEDTEEQQTEMMFIKEESEHITNGVKHEDTEEQQTEMMFIKEETIEVKQEDTEEQTGMMFIKEESEHITNEVKHEDTEEQTGLFHQLFCGMNLFTSLYLTHSIMINS